MWAKAVTLRPLWHSPYGKPGDRVLFSKYAGTEIKIDGTEHLMMREEDILGVIEK